MKQVAVVVAIACLAGCGSKATENKNDLLAQEMRREARAGLNSGSAQLAGAALSNKDTTGAMRVYLHAVDTAAGVLPTRYIVNNRLVGLRSMKTVIEPWCKACARQLEQKTRSLLKRSR